MIIWVDADACPAAIKEILFRAAERTGVSVMLVANHMMRVPKLKQVRLMQVAGGFDVADKEIVERVQPGDLVITADIPLAADVIAKDAAVITPRGERYTEQNIKARLTMRNFMDEMRASGVQTGGPPALNNQDRKAFADQLDRWLAMSSPGKSR